jgi:L-ascorbate metabolism protein UlaG (beta-lactamase superfamily)
MTTGIGDAVEILKATGTLVANFGNLQLSRAKGAANYSPGNHGGRISFDDFDLVFANAWHSSSAIIDGTPIYLGNPSGFVIMPKREKGRTLYVTGDTGLSLDMKLIHDLYAPVIGILPIGDRFTMGPEQAAYACRKFFKFKVVIPCHYASFAGYVIPDATRFSRPWGRSAQG